MPAIIRTKIVITLGPACSDLDCAARLLEEGADVCRLNFSHGTLDEHRRMLAMIRLAASRFQQHIAILGDLGGPKIRLGPIADQQDGGMPIAAGDTLRLQRQPILGAHGRASINYPQLVDDVAVGDRVLIEDGLLRFVVVEKTADDVVCACTTGGILRTGKGVNLPNTAISLPSITERDWQCVDFAIENDLDYLALSFVRRADDMQRLRAYLEERGSEIDLVAKIEKPEALEQIDAILAASDGLMVARGDLGVEMDLAQVPIIQKDLVRRCRAAGKPVIVATQMLQSMIDNPTPTRAEVSDVANAIFDGADAVMLSGETSIGRYPPAAVHMMNHIARVTEAYCDSVQTACQPVAHTPDTHLSGAVAHGVWQIVHDLKIRLVVVWSQSGATARVFSKFRFPVPIVAFSSNPRILRQMAIHFGVIPEHMQPPVDLDALIEQVDQLVRQRELAAPGDRVVIVSGPSLGTPGTKSGIVIHTLSDTSPNSPSEGSTA